MKPLKKNSSEYNLYDRSLFYFNVNNLISKNDCEILKCLKNIREMLRYAFDEKRNEDLENEQELKWIYAAKVFDRLFLFFCLVFHF